MILISGIICLIIQKNTLCKIKITRFIFAYIASFFLPENVYLFAFGGGVSPLAFHARASMTCIIITTRSILSTLIVETSCLSLLNLCCDIRHLLTLSQTFFSTLHQHYNYHVMIVLSKFQFYSYLRIFST